MTRPWRLETYDVLPSTADVCRARARGGESDGLVVMARAQSCGRGTHGRRWETPAGNVALSALLRPRGHPQDVVLWGMLAAVAVSDAAMHVGGVRVRWPNDVLVGGVKCAGILVESDIAADGRLEWVGIGIGVNVATAPDLPDRPTTCLNAHGSLATAESLAADILQRLAQWRLIQESAGFGPILDAWTARSAEPGTCLTVRLPTAEIVSGAFAGVTGEGRLLLRTKHGSRAFAPGEARLA